MRKCPKCGMEFPGKGRMRCNANYGGVKCDTATIEMPDWTDEDEAKAMEDLEQGIMEDPFEDYVAKPKKEKTK